jgi:hypothetical protein
MRMILSVRRQQCSKLKAVGFLFFKGGGAYAESRPAYQLLATGQVAFHYLRGQTQRILETLNYYEGCEEMKCEKQV